MRPKRIQRKRTKDWRMPPGAVSVDRSTKWGNPFIVGVHGTRARCVELYTRLAQGLICATDVEHMKQQEAALAVMRTAPQELRGKDLACWCPPGAPCHADVLLELANGPLTGEEPSTP